MNDLNGLITSLRPNTEDAYRRRRDTDLARVFATQRRRFSLRWRLLAAATPVALAGIVAAYALTPDAAPPPAQSVSASSLHQYVLMSWEGPGIKVFLCEQNDPWTPCGGTTTEPAGGGTAITEQERADLERTLRELPGVESVTFEDRATAYAKFREIFKDSPEASKHLQAVRMMDMPESYTVTMEPGADRNSVIGKAKSMPGVAHVFDPGRAR
ncbi:permease-like cell division protein FtsX [Spongiactinospora sp. 9N601]|uniref:permease-like cell division protein FtsX n=1 Tax=Spongiactinospora sp. 9N601 TaxID=3375149 RepID=UPI00378F8C5E